MSITIRFAGAPDADASTTYDLKGDQATAGTFVAITSAQGATSPYAPVSTTLSGALTATDTTIVLTSGASFSDNDYVVIDGETIKLGTKNTNTFTGCTRGIGASVPIAHLNGATVYKAHETFTVTPTWNAGRYAIRYQIIRNQSGDSSPALEFILVNPPAQTDTDQLVVYGIEEDENGAPESGVTVQCTLSVDTAWGQGSGEHVFHSTQSVTSGADGFWCVRLRKDAVRQDGGIYTITIDPNGKNQQFTITSVPDLNYCNFLDLA